MYYGSSSRISVLHFVGHKYKKVVLGGQISFRIPDRVHPGLLTPAPVVSVGRGPKRATSGGLAGRGPLVGGGWTTSRRKAPVRRGGATSCCTRPTTLPDTVSSTARINGGGGDVCRLSHTHPPIRCATPIRSTERKTSFLPNLYFTPFIRGAL